MWWFDVAVVAVVVLQIINFWHISKGKIPYMLLMFIYVGYIIIETTLALKDEDQQFVLLFNLVNFWALAMTIKGYVNRRSREI
jgi:uncharacterized membrane protein